ncbi:hypothetical protein EVAR_25403_1 [Eumeta japonica]|uniref:Uncharacterized protein n=1 Tax=Eumeta variegata TaxID=151549 RepID=A0A4C1V6B3_EUMVA|nr:hypothetical protein EVAR_25403_1 [Eumeta japonica]
MVKNEILDIVDTTLFLDLTLDAKLRWNSHITRSAKRLGSAAYAVKRIRRLTVYCRRFSRPARKSQAPAATGVSGVVEARTASENRRRRCAGAGRGKCINIQPCMEFVYVFMRRVIGISLIAKRSFVDSIPARVQLSCAGHGSALASSRTRGWFQYTLKPSKIELVPKLLEDQQKQKFQAASSRPLSGIQEAYPRTDRFA